MWLSLATPYKIVHKRHCLWHLHVLKLHNTIFNIVVSRYRTVDVLAIAASHDDNDVDDDDDDDVDDDAVV